jgi:CheY-specific phosphatase CheX
MDQALADSAVEVLESMFFTSRAEDGVPSENSHGPWISARLWFRGNPPGRFGIRTPLETGRKLSANFLGLEEDEIEESQIGEVVRELANMLCGSVLSLLERDSRFELSGPEIDAPEVCCPKSPTARRTLELAEGPLAMWIELEQAG